VILCKCRRIAQSEESLANETYYGSKENFMAKKRHTVKSIETVYPNEEDITVKIVSSYGHASSILSSSGAFYLG